jgi:polyisoprenoid-binding protein YceI
VTQYRVLPDRSQLWIDARSDIHPIHGEGRGLEGQAEVHVDDGHLDLSVAPTGRIELAVDRLTSGSAMQDKEMLRRIESRKFPRITAELRQVTPRGDANGYRIRSDITFHGIARRVPVDVTATLGDDRTLVVEGQFTLDVRGFELTPPKVLGLQVYPDVAIRLRVVLQSQ